MKNSKTNLFVIAFISIYLVIPIAFTFFYSISVEWKEILPKGITFRYYMDIFTDMGFLLSIINSLIISVIPVFVSVIIIIFAMYVVILYIPGLDKYIQILCTIPYAIQGIILSVSVLSIYADAPAPFSNRILMLVGTYCIVILPYVYRGIRNSLYSINALRLVEAAQILGSGKLYAFFKVVVPNIFSGVTAASLMSAAIIFGDFVVVRIIGGNYFQTSQVYLYNAMHKSGQLVSAMVVILFVVTLIISGSVYFTKNKRAIIEEEQE
jgi:putative spermidine/putrescine transport system permease protein